MVLVNILLASRTHLTPKSFSLPVKPYLNAVSALVIGCAVPFAVAFIICDASSTFGLIAVL